MHSEEYNEYLLKLEVHPYWKSKAEIEPTINKIKNDIFIHDEDERMELIKRYREYANTLPDHYNYPRYDDVEDGWNTIEGIEVFVSNGKVLRTATGARPFEHYAGGLTSVTLTPTQFARDIIDDKIVWD